VARKAILAGIYLFVGEFALLTSEVLQQWLEKRFLLHLWDDEDAAERERERVLSTQQRLSQEFERLRQLID
jgi:hypothetical protein